MGTSYEMTYCPGLVPFIRPTDSETGKRRYSDTRLWSPWCLLKDYRCKVQIEPRIIILSGDVIIGTVVLSRIIEVTRIPGVDGYWSLNHNSDIECKYYLLTGTTVPQTSNANHCKCKMCSKRPPLGHDDIPEQLRRDVERPLSHLYNCLCNW